MAFNYKLTSCDPLSYPDIDCLGWASPHPMQGKFVFINETFNGNPVNSNEVYQLEFLGENFCIFSQYVPDVIVTTTNSCASLIAEIEYKNCETGELEVFGFTTTAPTQNFLMLDNCQCWERLAEKSPATKIVSFYSEFDSCVDCIKERNEAICNTNERTLSYAVRVKLPEPVPPNRGFKECCYTSKVFGDLLDSSSYKNDFTGVYYKRPTSNSSVVFKLVDTSTAVEYLLNDDTYGVFQDFGGIQEDLSFYILEWRKVLSLLGAGNYQIKQEVSVIGIAQDYYTNTFTLDNFSIDKADNTVRLDCTQDGYLVDQEADFKNTGFKTSIRVSGFFGRAEHAFEEKIITTTDYNGRQVNISVDKEYKYQGLQIPNCIADEIFDFILKGNELFVSDYNKNNHSYRYELLPVRLQGNEGSEYQTLNRGVKINLLFTDRVKNNRKFNC